MSIKFYNVKKRESVNIDESKCQKVIYRKETDKGVQERFGIKSVDEDGTKLTTFCSKEKFEALNCPLL